MVVSAFMLSLNIFSTSLTYVLFFYKKIVYNPNSAESDPLASIVIKKISILTLLQMEEEENGKRMSWYGWLTWLVWLLHGCYMGKISATYAQSVKINGIGLTVKFLNTHRT